MGEWSEWGACQPTDGCPLFPVQQLTTTGKDISVTPPVLVLVADIDGCLLTPTVLLYV